MRTRKPIRHLNGKGWQVMHDLSQPLIKCASQEDAVLIAEAESLCKDVFDGHAGSEDLASRLDAMADAVARNIGGGTLLRYIQHAEKRARGATT